jgi:hypothetical protein
MMSKRDIERRLRDLGQWQSGLRLEPFELLANQSPPGALAGVQPYMLVNDNYTPARDAPGRPWRPVLVTGDDLLLDPTPAMLDRFLAAAGYWEQPEAFGDTLLLQFHRFALDFYQGYQVREEQFERQPGRLIIRGQATKGVPRNLEGYTFETQVGRHEPANFTVQAHDPLAW